MFPKLICVKANNKYSIRLKYSDNTEGVIDLSHLAGKGIFKEWDNNDLFSKVFIDEYGAVAWNEKIDLCADSLYLRLKGISYEQWKQKQIAYASNK